MLGDGKGAGDLLGTLVDKCNGFVVPDGSNIGPTDRREGIMLVGGGANGSFEGENVWFADIGGSVGRGVAALDDVFLLRFIRGTEIPTAIAAINTTPAATITSVRRYGFVFDIGCTSPPVPAGARTAVLCGCRPSSNRVLDDG